MEKPNNTEAPVLIRKIKWKSVFLVFAKFCVLILAIASQDFTTTEAGPRALPQVVLSSVRNCAIGE
jgi:hypothetical protein